MKSLVKKISFYFLTTHIFISLIAVALSLETAIILHQPFQDISLYLFIFTSTHFAYNVYYVKKSRLYRVVSVISLIANLCVIFFIPAAYYVKLLFIAIASGIYIFPVFFSFKKDKSFSFQKLLLLIFIWVSTTFVLPASDINYDFDTMVMLLYRVVLLSSVTLLFFIRDEKIETIKQKAIAANYVLAVLHIVIAVITLFSAHKLISAVFLFISILCFVLVVRFLNKKFASVYYLAYVDGIMFLQSMMIILLYFLKVL